MPRLRKPDRWGMKQRRGSDRVSKSLTSNNSIRKRPQRHAEGWQLRTWTATDFPSEQSPHTNERVEHLLRCAFVCRLQIKFSSSLSSQPRSLSSSESSWHTAYHNKLTQQQEPNKIGNKRNRIPFQGAISCLMAFSLVRLVSPGFSSVVSCFGLQLARVLLPHVR